MKLPKIPEKAVPLIILLAVVAAVFLYSSTTGSEQPSGDSLAISGTGSPSASDSGDAVVEALSGHDAEADQALNAEEQALEKKVAEALAKMAGVGKVHVTITFESGVLREYATEGDNTERISSEKDAQGGERTTTERSSSEKVVISGSEPALKQLERARIAGVLVVVEGQDNQLLTKVRESVRTLLGIEASKVSVVAMAK